MRTGVAAGLVLAALALAIWWKLQPPPPGKWQTEVYVWQRGESPALREALEKSHEVATRRHFLGVEIGRDGSEWRVSRTTLPDDLLAGEGLVLRIGASLAGQSWQDGEALERVLKEAAWMAAKPVAECQIDYDSPQRSLANYRLLLEAIKKRFPQKRWTLTALPSWLGEADAAALFVAADGVVLQVHSLTLPERPERPVILCDPVAARAAVHRMSRFDVPFLVALNTYGCEVFFDENGGVLDVVSEDVPQSPPNGAVRRTAGISEATELAALVAEWRNHRPPGMRGVVWYRLPLETDRRNWRWITWQRAAAGKLPHSNLRVEARRAGEGLWDLVLKNDGERDERLPESIAAGCATLALDGLNGYTAATGDQWILEEAAWPWLAPGDSLTIGWLRPVDDAATPAPRVVSRP
jgi:hypothetical protein